MQQIVLNQKQLAAFFNKTPETVARWSRSPGFPRARVLGGRRYWIAKEIADWLASPSTSNGHGTPTTRKRSR